MFFPLSKMIDAYSFPLHLFLTRILAMWLQNQFFPKEAKNN